MGYLRWAVLLAVLLATAGCIKVDQTLTLTKDGSGTFDIRYGMAEQTIAQLEAMQQMGKSLGDSVEVEQEDSPFNFDEAKLRAKFNADKPVGVELLSVRSEVVDGWKFMSVQLGFDDLAALKHSEFFAESALSLTQDANGNYVLTQHTGNGGAAGGLGAANQEAMGAEMIQQMAAMFAGMRIVTSVALPTEIIESNATEVAGQTASWVFDVDKDPGVLTKLDNMELRVVFSGKGLSLKPVVEDAPETGPAPAVQPPTMQ